MTKGSIALIALSLLIIIAAIVLLILPAPRTVHAPTTSVATSSELANLILVTSPAQKSVIVSPLTIEGRARGSWYFEASAPIILKNSEGTTIAEGHIEATSNWMTEDYVPFTASLAFPAQSKGSTGTLVLENDNPSGDPAKHKELAIPVTF